MSKDPLSLVLNKLSRRAYSKNEIKKYLIDKGYTLDDVMIVMEKLNRWGYINDYKLAENIIDYHKRVKPCGKYLMEKKMLKRELSHELIHAVINENISFEDEYQMADCLTKKYLKCKADRTNKNTVYALARYLERKGFSRDIINTVINSIDL